MSDPERDAALQAIRDAANSYARVQQAANLAIEQATAQFAMTTDQAALPGSRPGRRWLNKIKAPLRNGDSK
jgi:hypothetical protein